MELLPVAKDSINGGHIAEFFAITCAWAGETDLAIQQLTTIIPSTGHITYGYLKLHPFWDPLRGDPRSKKSSRLSRQRNYSDGPQSSCYHQGAPRCLSMLPIAAGLKRKNKTRDIE